LAVFVLLFWLSFLLVARISFTFLVALHFCTVRIMVLAELGNRLTAALNKLNSTTIVDDDVVKGMLKDISRALLESDVNVKIVMGLQNKMKSRLNLEMEAPGTNKRKMIQKIVMEELVSSFCMYVISCC
jgi:signal recognition particle GTPase